MKIQTDEIEVIQKEARAALNEAMPALHEAMRALDSINKQDISEIKTFPSPPKLVRFTLETICILLKEKRDWDSIKRMLSDTKFIDRLKLYDKDNIPKKMLKKFRKKIYGNK